MQFSCAASSDKLSDRVRFPYYFQLLPSEVNLARVFYSIIKEYGWRRVAFIVQNEHRYLTVYIVISSYIVQQLYALGYLEFKVHIINFLPTQTIRRLKQYLSESKSCDYVEMIFDADGDLTSLNNIKVRLCK